jgi:hypothetical protein
VATDHIAHVVHELDRYRSIDMIPKHLSGSIANGWGDENAHSGGQFEQIKHFHFCSLVFYANGHI